MAGQRNPRPEESSLPAVFGNLHSASRLKRARLDPAAEKSSIDASLAAAMVELDDLELRLPSVAPEPLYSMVPELPATISIAPIAAEPSAPRSTYSVVQR